ncbi:hypothetical protein ABXJ76_14680 [Methylobacter sp. G7]|uniref:hypothetical protein n=1 Tax=Methylobacter sp. G7 TaxID=3230117 RepID=UPI003D805428
MKSIITPHATPNAWLTNSVLTPHLDAFIAHLQCGRYAAGTTSGYLRGIAPGLPHLTFKCNAKSIG